MDSVPTPLLYQSHLVALLIYKYNLFLWGGGGGGGISVMPECGSLVIAAPLFKFTSLCFSVFYLPIEREL